MSRRLNRVMEVSSSHRNQWFSEINSIITLVFVIAIFLFITTIIIRAVPINMDESTQYHIIACDFYDSAKYHNFWFSCNGSLNLNLLSIPLKRAYPYIGSFSSYLYYPFFRLYPSILTQRLLGVFFLVIFVAVLMLLEKENTTSVMVLFGLSFPIIYQLIIDTGPVRYGIFMSVFTPLFTKVILRTDQYHIKILLNIILAFMLFLAVEDKPFFLYIIPSIALLTIAYNHEQKKGQITIDSMKLLLRKMWVSIVTFFSLTLLYLLMAKTASGQAYLFKLMELVKPQAFMESVAYLLSYITNFQKFSSFVYDNRRFRIVNIAFSLSICCYGIFFIAKTYRNLVNSLLPPKVLFTLLAFVTSIFVLLLMRNAWAGHHFIYPYIFGSLIICQCISYEGKRKDKFLILCSSFSLILTIQLLLLVPASHSSWERYKIFEYLKQETIARDYIITHLDWGTYTISSLYGHKDQLAIAVNTWSNVHGHQGISIDSKIAMKIIDLSRSLNRKVLCICHGPHCNSENLANGFLKMIEFEEINLSNNDWKLYLERNRI